MARNREVPENQPEKRIAARAARKSWLLPGALAAATRLDRVMTSRLFPYCSTYLFLRGPRRHCTLQNPVTFIAALNNPFPDVLAAKGVVLLTKDKITLDCDVSGRNCQARGQT